MRNYIFLLVAAMFCAATVNAQSKDFSGSWQGKMDIGKQITIIFHFKKAGDSYTGTLDCPEQNAKGVPLNNVTVKGDSVTAELKVSNVIYAGVLTGDSTVDGKWQQGGGAIALNVKRIPDVKPVALKRPQTPVPPYNYNSEDVEYDNADKSVHFGATFTYPKTGSNFPTAILITGSGSQDRDETILGHKPFAVLADYLTKKGYAILRIDDRGTGKTTGSLINVTSADFAKDIEAGLAYVKTRNEVNKNKLGLIGHSEGGVIAPMVAAEHKEIDFIVLWAGPMIGGLKTNTEQNGFSLRKAGIDSVAVEAFKQLHSKELSQYAVSADISALHVNVKRVYDEWRKQQPANVLTALGASDSTVVGMTLNNLYDGLYSNSWMRFFITHDFAADLAKVHCRVLALNGDLDTQVDAAANLQLIDDILGKNNPHNPYTIVKLKGLNHLFQTAVTGDVGEYGTIEETIAPQALKTIGDWMGANVMNRK